MKPIFFLTFLACVTSAAAAIKPAAFDTAEIRNTGTLETTVIEDWHAVPKLNGIKRKLIEITVCEWWPGQKVRLPVTLCAPDRPEPCTHIIVGNMGLGLKPAQPTGAMLRLLSEQGVGVVLVGMGTIDAMEPKGRLHLGMKEQLLKTRDAKYTPAWIWGMSDMRGLTAAVAEKDVFQPGKVLATGGSKRGVGAAVCGIFDDRFTAILPVVAPIMGNPGGAYVRDSALHAEAAANAAFLANLPPQLPETAKAALEEREQRRGDQSITRSEALAAGWSEAEMLQMNDEAWNICRITDHLKAVRQRGLEFFYHVGTNDNVCPQLRMLGEMHPDFPISILPGGQHGGPKTTGFTLQTPAQPEVEDNLHAFARHHFFNDRSLPAAPKVTAGAAGGMIQVKVAFAPGVRPEGNQLSWCFNRNPPCTYAAEYDQWESTTLTAKPDGTFAADIAVPANAGTVDFISTHTHVENGIPFHFSSPYQRWNR